MCRKIIEKRTVVVRNRCNVNVLHRRLTFQKFGDCINGGVEKKNVQTTIKCPAVSLDLGLPQKTSNNDNVDNGINAVETASKLMQLKTESTILCRNCKQRGHFTAQCPKKKSDTEVVKVNESKEDKSKYVPVHLRENVKSILDTLKFLELPQDTTEIDLKNLCRPFGKTCRIKILSNQNLKAFVTFENPSDAQRACQGLNKYPYGGLILEVECVANRK